MRHPLPGCPAASRPRPAFSNWTTILALALTLALPSNLRAGDIRLPELGDSSSSVISQHQEYQLGRAWLKVFRRQVRTHHDPQLQHYLEQLIAQLALRSTVKDRRFEVVIVNNPTINAFAVPGGIIGVHTGLFFYAESEHQLASVLSHELAHLGQRHFARRLELQRKSSTVSLAGLLAGLVLAATVGGEAGMAAISASQAATMDTLLRYSRQNEQEADRMGLDILFRSGMDPAATAAMFERMQASTRFLGKRPPEFLLTHPLTESRISDARSRIAKYPSRQYLDNLEYHLMRVRSVLALEATPAQAASRFENELSGSTLSRRAARYGLALAQSSMGEHKVARKTLAPLLAAEPERLSYQLAAATIERNAGRYANAIKALKKLAMQYPENYAIGMELAETLLAANRYGESERTLEALSRKRPTDPKIWFELAETSGLAGDISGVHLARAEYFILTGVFDKAREHLGYARKLLDQDFRQSARIDQRLRDLTAIEKHTERL